MEYEQIARGFDKLSKQIDEINSPYRELYSSLQKQLDKTFAPVREIQDEITKRMLPYKEMQQQVSNIQLNVMSNMFPEDSIKALEAMIKSVVPLSSDTLSLFQSLSSDLAKSLLESPSKTSKAFKDTLLENFNSAKVVGNTVEFKSENSVSTSSKQEIQLHTNPINKKISAYEFIMLLLSLLPFLYLIYNNKVTSLEEQQRHEEMIEVQKEENECLNNIYSLLTTYCKTTFPNSGSDSAINLEFDAASELIPVLPEETLHTSDLSGSKASGESEIPDRSEASD